MQVEGQTALRARVPTALAEAEASVGDVLSRLADAHRGTPSDAPVRGTLFRFPTSIDAIRFATAVQDALLEIAWPATLLLRPELGDVEGPGGLLFRGLRVRAAVVEGPVWVSGDAIAGPAVHRVARLVSLAHGGQTLLSDAVRRALPADVVALTELDPVPWTGELGQHRVIQALPHTLAAREFPPLRTADERGGNLREDPDFVGRQQDVAAIEELSGLGVRIVSIEGPAGVGKSHLCRQYARLRQSQSVLPGGVWWAGPAVADLETLVQTVATVLGVGLQYATDVTDGVRQVGRALASRGPTLVALDLSSPAPAIREAIEHWTTMAPETTFVVATPARLRAKGEVTYQLGPLGLPSETSDHHAVRDADAVRLFAHRAERAGASLSAPDDPALVEALETLAGNPRRIRLLAGLLERCSPDEVITTGTTGSLAAILEASWDTLTTDERTLVRHCATSGHRAFDTESLAVAGIQVSSEALAQLERQGLVDRVLDAVAADLVRYVIGEEVRAWIDAHAEPDVTPANLDPTPADSDAETAPRLVALTASAPAEDTDETEPPPPDLENARRIADDPVDGPAAAWIGTHFGAFRAPIDHALAGDTVTGLEHAAAHWLAHRDLRHFLPLFELLPLTLQLIGRAEQVGGMTPSLLGPLYLQAAALHLQASDPDAARGDLERARDVLAAVEDVGLRRRLVQWSSHVARESGTDPVVALRPDEVVESRIDLAFQGLDAMLRGDDEEAVAMLSPLVDPPMGDRLAVPWAMALVRVLRRTGRVEQAEALGTRWAKAVAPLGDARAEAQVAERRGWVDYHLGRLEDADHLWSEALQRARRKGDRWAEGLLLGPVGLLALSRGDLEGCRTQLQSALAIHRDHGDRPREGRVTGLLGILDHVGHQPQAAAEHYRRALDLLSAGGPSRDGALFAAFAAALEAESGRLETAEQRWAEAESQQAVVRDADVAATMDQLRLTLWWVRAQGFDQAGDTPRATTLVTQARDRIAAALARDTPLPGEARLALARVDRLFGRA